MSDRELKLPDWYDYESEPCNDVREGKEKALIPKPNPFQARLKIRLVVRLLPVMPSPSS